MIHYVTTAKGVLLLILYSCQEDEIFLDKTVQDGAEKWKVANIEKAFPNPHVGYFLSKRTFQHILKSNTIKHIRFVLELHNKQLHIRVVSIHDDGKVNNGILLNPHNLEKNITLLKTNKNKKLNIHAVPLAISKHMLQPNRAVTYVQNWEEAFYKHNLTDCVSYKENRISHYTMQVNVFKHMIKNIDFILCLVWGINNEGKLTTIFISQNNEVTNQNYIYDFTRPCPPHCDPIK